MCMRKIKNAVFVYTTSQKFGHTFSSSGFSLLPSPTHHTYSSMLRRRNHAYRDLLFTLSVLYKDTVGETKDLNFGLIRQKHKKALVKCPWQSTGQGKL